jgi:DNA (cytosine-5)-methyltransferase 1
MNVLNLYSGIGGNRKLWTNVQVTAVEFNKDIAEVYKKFFPNDIVIIGDAHEYLLKNYQDFDFIWASPPCQTHSRINFSNGGRWNVRYPDMKLYEEIILLQTWFKGKWVVENVIHYYQPLIKPQESGRHYFWANFKINKVDYGNQIRTPLQEKRKKTIREAQIPELESLHKFDLTDVKIPNKRQVLRNCVIPELGLHVINCAKNTIVNENFIQLQLF